jgi:hypothetical protein
MKKSGTLAALLGAFLLLGTVVPMQAQRHDRDDKCERKIHQAEERLNQAIRRHGERSRQAQQRRHQLEEQREKCRRERERHHDGDRH